jgi:DNA-binding NarL/FixJ family response regulator
MTNNLNAMEAKTNTNDNATATRITAAFEPTTAPAPIKVWLVDDDDSYRTLLADFLVTQQGIDCPRHFDSPDAALSALASKTGPDVLLLDIHMRDRNGLDAIRPIKSLARSTRVLMLTTFYDGGSHSRAMEEGASGFLLKSAELKQLVEGIRKPDAPDLGRAQRRRTRSSVPAAAQVPSSHTARPGHSKWWRRLPLLNDLLR